jgi:hypothetical protein
MRSHLAVSGYREAGSWLDHRWITTIIIMNHYRHHGPLAASSSLGYQDVIAPPQALWR